MAATDDFGSVRAREEVAGTKSQRVDEVVG